MSDKLTLTLTKAGDAPKPHLVLNISKPSKFTVELSWDSTEDLDAHALLAKNSGSGAKITDMSQVLSTFNTGIPLTDGTSKTRVAGDKRPFQTPEGALQHSGDARSGVGADVDEIITVNGSLIPDGVNEIPIFVTIYPGGSSTFAHVKEASIRIKNDQGTVLAEYKLSDEFGAFDAVQMGSLILGDNGWSYAPVGSGFNGDLNTILASFS